LTGRLARRTMTGMSVFNLQVLVSAWVLFALLGLIVGALWRNRPLAGAMLWFLLGPLGLLCIGLLDDYRPGCSKCKAALVKDATRCRYCGVDLPNGPKRNGPRRKVQGAARPKGIPRATDVSGWG
jgi:hypothetical protein